MTETNPLLAHDDGRQMFRLVDARVTAQPSGGGCGCGGGGCGCGGRKARGYDAQSEALDGAPELARHRGGHGHGGGGCGCGGKKHGQAAASAQQPSPAQTATSLEELVVHNLPKVIRKAALFAALDAIPVGENLIINAPHEPAPVFEHLQESVQHYRVETLQAGPDAWRYRITRVS